VQRLLLLGHAGERADEPGSADLEVGPLGHAQNGTTMIVVSPSRILSPWTSSALARTVPFTRTPLIEPMSSTCQPSGRGISRACQLLAFSSFSTRSQSAPLPIRHRSWNTVEVPACRTR